MRTIDADSLEKEMLKKSVIIDEDEHEDEYAARGLNTYGMKQLFDEQPTVGAWIPVSERLPEEDILDCLVSVVHSHCNNDDYSNVTVKTWFRGDWLHIDPLYKVIAWQPLPEAYEEENND